MKQYLFPPTIIIQHRKENKKKCSLQYLKEHTNIPFHFYPRNPLPNLKEHMLLTLDAPALTPADKNMGICLLDATWRYAEKMHKSVITSYPKIICRSLPSRCVTAYPRKQTNCSSPERGLASIEALFLAYLILAREPLFLLNGYIWKESFLSLNKHFLESYSFSL
ncbi:MAG: ribosome biogenesis domain-containing protein [Chlamydiales bacterium]